MKTKIQIKTISGNILFEYEAESNDVKKTVEKAVSREADLRGACLRKAYLREAYLQRADLREAYLQRADLQGADLRGADLQGADLRGADLRGADLRGADLRGADLQGAYLQRADLRGADLQRAYLQRAYLQRADLQRADLRGADLRGADLRGADLRLYRNELTLLKYQKGKLRAFKYLNRDMKSPYQGFKYEIGMEYKGKNIDKDENTLCGKGLNVATLEWCLRDTEIDLDNKIYIEVEFDAKDVIVPYFTDGKFRVSKLKVIRIVPKKELEQLLK